MSHFTLPQNALPLLGRICIAALFVPSGWGKLGNFAGLVSHRIQGRATSGSMRGHRHRR
jgi:uncharacterized membrane protein YphA (DoxX/SURF4 family)